MASPYANWSSYAYYKIGDIVQYPVGSFFKAIANNNGVTPSASSPWSVYTPPGGGGVSSLNSKTGALSILAGTNVTVDNSVASQITINATGGSGGVTSVNGVTGPFTLTAGTNVAFTTSTPIGGGLGIAVNATGALPSGLVIGNAQTWSLFAGTVYPNAQYLTLNNTDTAGLTSNSLISATTQYVNATFINPGKSAQDTMGRAWLLASQPSSDSGGSLTFQIADFPNSSGDSNASVDPNYGISWAIVKY